MKANYITTIFFILSFVADSNSQGLIAVESNSRRILHQPLFPYTSSPPPPPSLPPPPPPDQNHPFFNELPNGQPADPQAPPTSTATTTAATPAAPRPENSTKKMAIVISAAVASVAMLSVLVYFLYKHRIKNRDESGKLFGRNSDRTNEESRMPPSTFLYIGTVEPSAASIADEANDAASSPYRKLNSGKRSSRYRQSPDLQPLPPLTKPQPPPPSINSPPPMSSSDDESHDTNFYTPQGSSMSNESPGSRHSYLSHSISQVNRVLPHSKRSSPKSRLSASSPDTKPVIIPSIKQSLPPSPPPPPPNSSLQYNKPLSYTPKRTKFPPPPPPIDMARLQKISNDDHQTSPIPVPPPPPPPPPPLPPHLSIPRNLGDLQNHTAPISNIVIKPQSKSHSPKSNPIPTVPNKGVEVDAEDKNGSRPKLKPLHWDKVRATSDRVTVWDQLNSSSFQ